jgi:hypothetical protein
MHCNQRAVWRTGGGRTAVKKELKIKILLIFSKNTILGNSGFKKKSEICNVFYLILFLKTNHHEDNF